jgi:hypothetical protein
MGVAIAFQSLSFIPLLGTGIAYLLKAIVWTLNTTVHYLEKLPMALLGGLDISVIETWLFYFIIIGFTVWLTQYKRKFVLVTLAMIFFLVVSQTIEKYNQLQQKQITFYQSGKNATIEFVNGAQTNFMSDSALLSNPDKMQFYIYHHWWKRGISSDIKTISIPVQKALTLGETKILRVENDQICSCNQVNILQPDVIFYNSYKDILLDSISSNTYRPIIIIGPKTSRKMTHKISDYCESKNWICHNMKSSGAIKIILDNNYKPKEFITANP